MGVLIGFKWLRMCGSSVDPCEYRYTLSGATKGERILGQLSDSHHLKTDDCSVEPSVYWLLTANVPKWRMNSVCDFMRLELIV